MGWWHLQSDLPYLDNAVAFSDVGQELVAEALALAGALHQTSNVHKLHRRGHCGLGAGKVCEDLQSAVWDGHDAHIRLNGAERKVGCLSLAILAHGVEER